MAKASRRAERAGGGSSRWSCVECGAATHGWFGRCPSCGAWNSVVEELERPSSRPSIAPRDRGSSVIAASEAVELPGAHAKLAMGVAELDRVLGGGLTEGSVTLVGGAPGIGKSTLLLQACIALARRGHTVLYASGEESVAQIGHRARRLAGDEPKLLLMADTSVDAILGAAEEHAAELLVIDSVQTVDSTASEGLPGNVSQIRSVTAQAIAFAKSCRVPVVLVGHVTKDGQLAGPRLLEHMVDTVLSFEGDDERATRLLRATKHRFGSTMELGVFEMTSAGLREVEDPSEAFLAERSPDAPGSCVTACLEGARPLLLEVQALLAPCPGGSPRRTCVGADPARLSMLLAVLDRHGGLFVSDQDVFVNVAGGLRLHEPAADLALLLAIASSHRRIPLPRGLVAIGEVGLTGELRRAPRSELRLQEAARLGFARAVLPRGATDSAVDRPSAPGPHQGAQSRADRRAPAPPDSAALPSRAASARNAAGERGAASTRVPAAVGGIDGAGRLEIVAVRTVSEALEAAFD